MPPAYVKPYVKRQKNDATDAEAICEAVTRANMPICCDQKPEQQSMRGGTIITPDLLKLNSIDICIPSPAASGSAFRSLYCNLRAIIVRN